MMNKVSTFFIKDRIQLCTCTTHITHPTVTLQECVVVSMGVSVCLWTMHLALAKLGTGTCRYHNQVCGFMYTMTLCSYGSTMWACVDFS